MRIAVVGGGSWGTALAIRCADGHAVRLWSRRADDVATIAKERENRRYLPGVRLPASIQVTSSLAEALRGQGDGVKVHATSNNPRAEDPAELVLLAVPAQALRGVMEAIAPLLPPSAVVVSAAKGFEPRTHQRMTEVVEQTLGRDDRSRIVALSGPCFAPELATGVFTAAVVACRDLDTAREVQRTLTSTTFRLHASQDVVGVEIGGAAKNVIAIAAGCSDGLGAGLNTRAALLTRGLAEMARLADRLGGDPRTLAGLAGLGDLMLTCTGDLSRNRRFGFEIGNGRSQEEAAAKIGQVVEGLGATRSARHLGREYGVELPITEQVHRVLFEGAVPGQAFDALMKRALDDELA